MQKMIPNVIKKHSNSIRSSGRFQYDSHVRRNLLRGLEIFQPFLV